MKPMRLLIALVTLALLGGAIWYSDKHPPKPDTVADTTPKAQMLSIKDDQINEIHISRPAQNDSLTLDKDVRGTWTIREPKEMAADPAAAKALATSLASLGNEQVVSDKVTDWSPYGLTQPTTVVQATLADGKKVEVDLGDVAPTGNPVYARVSGNGTPPGASDKLFGVTSTVKSSLDKSVPDLRDRRMLRVDVDHVSKVLFTNTQGAKNKMMEFTRSGTEWQFVQPHAMRAENYAVEELVRTASSPYDSVYTDDEKSAEARKLDFSKPWATVEVIDPAGSHKMTIQEQIIKADPKKPGDATQKNYYAKTSEMPGIFKLASTAGTTYDKGVNAFRRTSIFDINFGDPDKMELRVDNFRVTVERKPDKDKKEDQWFAGSKKLDSEKVQAFISLLRRLGAKDYPSDDAAEQAKYGLDKPVVDVKVTLSGKTQHVMMILKDGQAYAAKEGDPTTYLLDTVEFGDLQRMITEFK